MIKTLMQTTLNTSLNILIFSSLKTYVTSLFNVKANYASKMKSNSLQLRNPAYLRKNNQIYQNVAIQIC